MNTVYQCRRLVVLHGTQVSDSTTRPVRVWYWDAEGYLNRIGKLGWQLVSLHEQREHEYALRRIVVWVQCAITVPSPDAPVSVPPLPDQEPQDAP